MDPNDDPKKSPEKNSKIEYDHLKVQEIEGYSGNFMNSIGDPIFVKDDRSRLLMVNDAFCELFGSRREDVIGKTLAEEVSPEEVDSFLKIDRMVLETGVENINEETLTIRDGVTKIISTRKSRFVDDEGRKFLVGIIHDITESRKSARALQIAKERAEEYEDRFRILIQNMEAGVTVHAPDTSIVQSNERASEILGLTEDQLKGKTTIDPDWKFVYADNTPMRLEDYPVNRIASSKKPLKNMEGGVYQPGSDEVRWVSINGFPVFDNEGNIMEIVIVFLDITEQKINEEQKLANRQKLEKTQKELNEAQKLAGLGSWVFDLSTKEFIWSDEMYRIWGFKSQKDTPIIELGIDERIHPDDVDKFKSKIYQALEEEMACELEFRINIPDSEEKVIRSIFRSVADEDGEVIMMSGTVQDITLQKSFEEAQVKHQRLKAIGEMSSSIAHDFNNALQEMMGNLEVIKMEGELSGNSLKRLNDLRSIIADTASRVSALQRFGDSQDVEVSEESVDMNLLIEESLNQSRPLWKDEMEKEGLQIKVKTELKKIPKIRCNHGELKSVIFNLIKNSIEAMPHGGNLTIKTGTKDHRVYATFADTGSGMDAEAKLKVFEPFFTTKGYNLGRGLGMSGAYTIVKKCGGDIRVKYSEKGKGTTIEMTFPKSIENKGRKQTEAIVENERTYKVLWVDDDFIIAASSRKMIQSLGHTCVSVNSGKKALDYLEENDCELIFTDIGMPEMNGRELARAIRKKFDHKIKIIAVTGWNMKDIINDDNAFDGFLQKPFTMEDLKVTLTKL
jgi:PAS domain S-box-containing protein